MRRGRDSMRVRFTPRWESSPRQPTSQPGAWSPPPQNTIEVRAGSPAAGSEASDARASQTKRVALSGWSSTSASRTRQPYSSAARRDPSATEGPAAARTDSTASAVEGAMTSSAWGRRSRRNRAHWAVAWGWETTRVTSARSSSRAATRQWWIGCTTSATMRTPPARGGGGPRGAPRGPRGGFSDGTAALFAPPPPHRHDRLVDGWVRHLLDLARRGRSEGLLAEGPGGPQEGDAPQAGVPAIAASMASRSSG